MSSQSLSNLLLAIVKKITAWLVGFGKVVLTFLLNQLFPAEILSQKWRWRKTRHFLMPSIPVFHLGFYENELKDYILRLKFRGEFCLLEQMVTARLPAELVDARAKLVFVFVAQSRWRFANRGFNQARLLADRLAKLSGGEVKNCFSVSFSRTQTHFLRRGERLAKKERLKLVALPEAPVVLVDDILTTGATTAQYINLLQKEGVEVRGVVVLAVTKKYLINKKRDE